MAKLPKGEGQNRAGWGLQGGLAGNFRGGWNLGAGEADNLWRIGASVAGRD